jgi:bacillithiol biosynthesis deacetylase BshB1
MAEKLDLLVLAAHPDDAELGCGGTLIKHVQLGLKVGVIDFTRGELGTRGTASTRAEEAANAAEIIGLTARENLALPDGFFENTRVHQLQVIRMLRKYRPTIVIANALADRHPDHGKGAQLAHDACFLSGLKKIQTYSEEQEQELWRPKLLLHMIQSNYRKPDVIVDVTAVWEQKMKAVQAYKTQFHQPDAEPDKEQTFISTPGFLKFLESRAREYGQQAGVEFAEGFEVVKPPLVNDLRDLV